MPRSSESLRDAIIAEGCEDLLKYCDAMHRCVVTLPAMLTDNRDGLNYMERLHALSPEMSLELAKMIEKWLALGEGLLEAHKGEEKRLSDAYQVATHRTVN